jgi:hypothetical protein
MDMAEELDFEVHLENLPGSKGIAALSKMPREHLIAMGEFFKRCADDPERKCMSLMFRADGQITLGTI